MRTLAAVKRMFAVIALYAAKLIEPPAHKQLPPAKRVLRLETQTKE
ncbi:MAG: hypothetical protein NC084_11080 [Bacteroides sp.]|nr:hypothetical protein [Eubacterium sp.]MCM1419407.1 hypothetical protein [Roseburia sp.]MCM1463237.1 hypothetical protein [Bacteroides sp.]